MSAVTKLIYWVEPIKTGAVFGSVLTVLLALSSCSLLSVISHCCLAALMAVLGARLYTFVMVKAGKAQPGEDPLAQVCGASWCLSEDKVGEVSSLLAQGLNNLLPRARSLFLIHNSVESLQLAAGPLVDYLALASPGSASTLPVLHRHCRGRGCVHQQQVSRLPPDLLAVFHHRSKKQVLPRGRG